MSACQPRPTQLFASEGLRAALGLPGLVVASEAGQWTGSFKFRAAHHLAASVSQPVILTASSGNFGQALAYACKLLGKQAIVVMPETSAPIKIAAVREYGARVELVDTSVVPRARRVAELAAAHPEAYVASAYDDALVIAGNASLGRDLARIDPEVVVVPVGGGGLAAGVLAGLREAGCQAELVGAEPLIADDAARSWRAGRLIANEAEPVTIADGARTLSLGRLNWAMLRHAIAGIVPVPESGIIEAMRLLQAHAGLRVEPTGALAIASLLSEPGRFRGRRVCGVVSGSNVDPERYEALVGAQ